MLSAINQHSSECASTNTFSDCSVDKGRQKWKAEIKKLYPESTAVLEEKDDCMICLMALRTGTEKEGGSRPPEKEQRHQWTFYYRISLPVMMQESWLTWYEIQKKPNPNLKKTIKKTPYYFVIWIHLLQKILKQNTPH